MIVYLCISSSGTDLGYLGGGAELPIDGLLARICQDIDSQKTILVILFKYADFEPDKSLDGTRLFDERSSVCRRRPTTDLANNLLAEYHRSLSFFLSNRGSN